MNRRRVIIAIACAAVLGIIALGCFLLWPAEKEPVYDGKSLTDSLQGLLVYIHLPPRVMFLSPPQEYLDSQEVVRTVGTNAIPFYLRQIQTYDSPLKLKLVALARRQHIVKVHFVPAADKREMGIRGFITLAESASNAVPSLIQICEHNSNPAVRRAAVESLAGIGAPSRAATASLIRAATNTDLALSRSGVRALGMITAEPTLAIPVLIQQLTNSSDDIRDAAVMALTSFGSEAKPAIPTLFILLNGKAKNSPNSHWFIAVAIRKIDPAVSGRKPEVEAVLGGAYRSP